MNSAPCPVCQADCLVNEGVNADGVGADASTYDCEVCGKFEASRTLLSANILNHLTVPQHAALSHKIRRSQSAGGAVPKLTAHNVELGKLKSPMPSEQARNLILMIGDILSEGPEIVRELPICLPAWVGAASRQTAMRLVGDLAGKGLISGNERGIVGPGDRWINIYLTLDGWLKYEEYKNGQQPGKHGFIALPFSEADLDQFVNGHVRPVTEALGYPLEDMRIAAKAGLIDDLMRQHIRDARFVLAEVTHDNRGAYWEAGYAEGLGKPVVYLCRRAEFKNVHFDTNHCTTVIWDEPVQETFAAELTAVLRRSLGLFQ